MDMKLNFYLTISTITFYCNFHSFLEIYCSVDVAVRPVMIIDNFKHHLHNML